MPKRSASPELDSDNKFVAIYNPWPPTPRLDEKGGFIDDAQKLARWIACITGAANVLAIYFKPRSPNIVIVEVSGNFTQWPALLGLHSWAKVFKDPDEKEHRDVYKVANSKIYYSIYPTHRSLSKDGWKYIAVDDHWLRGFGFSPKGRVVNYPYPPTEWCELPKQDGDKQFCRVIPRTYFPGLAELAMVIEEVKAPPKPAVPGTNAWADSKNATKLGRAPDSILNPAWAKGKPSKNGKPPAQSGVSASSSSIAPRKTTDTTVISDSAMRAILGLTGRDSKSSLPSKAMPVAGSTSSKKAESITVENLSRHDSKFDFDDEDEDEDAMDWMMPSKPKKSKKTVTKMSQASSVAKAPSKASQSAWDATSIVSKDDATSASDFWKTQPEYSWADDYDDKCQPLQEEVVSEPEPEPEPEPEFEYGKDPGGWDDAPKRKETGPSCPFHGFQCTPAICTFAKDAQAEARAVTRGNRGDRETQSPNGADRGGRWGRISRSGRGRGRGGK